MQFLWRCGRRWFLGLVFPQAARFFLELVVNRQVCGQVWIMAHKMGELAQKAGDGFPSPAFDCATSKVPKS
jgi:hypothetical protein